MVLANPEAGSQRITRRQLREALTRARINGNVRWVDGRRLRHAARRAVSEGARVVVVAGGDGSVNAAASALAATRCTLGVIPTGTRNHFARDAGIPLDPMQAAHVVANGRIRSVDVGVVNGRVFLNNSSVGIYPRIVHQREELRRSAHHGRWIATVLAATDVLRRRPLIGVQLDVGSQRTVRRVPFVFVGNNAYSVHGLRIGHRRRLDRGELAAYLPLGSSRWGLLALSARALVGNLRDAKNIHRFHATALRVDSGKPDLRVATDGEVVRLRPPLDYTIRPRALRVLVPAEDEA